MKQLIHGGFENGFSNSTTRYCNLHQHTANSATTSTSATSYKTIIPNSGTLRNLSFQLTNAPGSGKSWTFTVQKNGSDTGLTVTISDTNTEGSDTTNTVTVAAGDLLAIKSVPSGTPTAMGDVRWVSEFEGDTAKRYFVSPTFNPSGLANDTRYSPVINTGLLDGNRATESDVNVVIPHSTTLKSVYVALGAAPGGSASRTYVIRKNGSDEASTELTISGTDISGSVTGLNVSFSAGDLITIKNTTGANVPAGAVTFFGIEFEATTDGESMLTGIPITSSFGTVTFYTQFNEGTRDSLEIDMNFCYFNASADIKNLYVYAETAPGTGESMAITLRKNASDTALTATVSGTGTTANDTSNTISFTSGDKATYSVVPSASATGGRYSISAVQAIGGGAPPVVRRVFNIS